MEEINEGLGPIHAERLPVRTQTFVGKFQSAAPSKADAAMLAATFSPSTRVSDDLVSHPAILIAGQAVIAYIQDGVLVVEVGVGEDDSGALNLEAGHLVPICFRVEGETAAMLGPEPEAWQ